MATRGLKFERTFAKALLTAHCIIEHNPWFEYQDGPYKSRGGQATYRCCPDILLYPPLSLAVSLGDLIVVEVKQTYVPNAITKLRELYVPVVELALDKLAKPLIVVKSLASGGPKAAATIKEALTLDPPIYQWLGTGPIILI